MYTVGGGLLSNSDFLYECQQFVDTSWIVKDNKNIEYYNIPAA